jgi:hypothetical protein
MRQVSKRIPDSAEKTVRDIRRPSLRRLLSLAFPAGAAVLFIHCRVAAEWRGGAGDFFFMIAGGAGRGV